jgi:hypothetical protein
MERAFCPSNQLDDGVITNKGPYGGMCDFAKIKVHGALSHPVFQEKRGFALLEANGLHQTRHADRVQVTSYRHVVSLDE